MELKLEPMLILLTLALSVGANLEKELGAQHKTFKAKMQEFFKKQTESTGMKYEPNKRPVGDSLPSEYDDGTEMSQNRKILDELFETDMVLTPEQMQHLIDNLDTKTSRRKFRRRDKRKIIKSETYRWKSTTIPYKLDIYDYSIKDKIRAALRHWEEKTCLHFTKNGYGKDRISFFQGSGCYSSIGRTGGTQEISIVNGCEKLGIIAHEIGHALGFWHEQSRPDRDRYIWINNHYLIGGTNSNFALRSWSDVSDFGIPYDLGSVMHYAPKSFTTDWSKRTIDTRDPNYRNTIGQRVELSFVDVKLVNEAYCKDRCNWPLSCKHNGYANPNRCNQCICPSGLAGNYCYRVERSKSNCGGELRATYKWQTITIRTRRC